MMSIVNSVFGLLIALGILVTIHEYGHFWVARKFGVKVLRFSVGFGQPIWRKTDAQGTEYVVAWIPLGGYVKMLDEREGEVAQEELHQAFTQKTPLQKILIAFAGPAANFLFAILAFALVNMVGVRDLVPLIDTPPEQTIAGESLQRGDRILAVDGNPVDSFSELNLTLASRVGDTGNISVLIQRQGRQLEAQLTIERWLADEQSPSLLGDLGIRPMLPEFPAVIGRLEPGEAAEAAGLQVGDRVIAAGERQIESWSDWVQAVQASADQSLLITIDRAGERVDLLLTPRTRNEEGSSFGYVGAAAEPVQWPEDQLVTQRYNPLSALLMGVTDTWQMVELSYQMLWKMVTGTVSLTQIGGPISMAQMAGMSVSSGFESFVGFLAFISISLAIVNLLPVPVLDGGHILLHSVEWLRGKALSERAQIVSMQLGMAFIISLMLLAFVNDIGRIL